ncbi:Zinc metalloproteinase nas-7 [Folsomia candida]|uniref:Zinc metalloproteinase nas-7 n=1 Tax=Folsomia candida TaxID=158441 RepID=A0A226E7S1_FOLCA|nr:Zinc metalloproteinase nas-7 [Folsomia candida]
MWPQDSEPTGDYVEIVRDYHFAYDILQGSITFGVPYDVRSIMHYNSQGFSSNGQPTILTKVRIRLLAEAKNFPNCHPVRPELEPHQRLEAIPLNRNPNLEINYLKTCYIFFKICLPQQLTWPP